MSDKCPTCGRPRERFWGDGPDEFHVRSLRFDGPEGETLYGLAKSFGGEIVEWVPPAQLRTAFTGQQLPRYSHADMVRKVPA